MLLSLTLGIQKFSVIIFAVDLRFSLCYKRNPKGEESDGIEKAGIEIVIPAVVFDIRFCRVFKT